MKTGAFFPRLESEYMANWSSNIDCARYNLIEDESVENQMKSVLSCLLNISC